MKPTLMVALAMSAVVACSPAGGTDRVARSTLVIGIDVSGSFTGKGRYASSIDFTSISSSPKMVRLFIC